MISVDPLLLFQRISLLKKTNDELKLYLEYELAPFPLSIFTDNGLRKCKKFAIYDLRVPATQPSTEDITVIDGGFLLHRKVYRLLPAPMVIFVKGILIT